MMKKKVFYLISAILLLSSFSLAQVPYCNYPATSITLSLSSPIPSPNNAFNILSNVRTDCVKQTGWKGIYGRVRLYKADGTLLLCEDGNSHGWNTCPYNVLDYISGNFAKVSSWSFVPNAIAGQPAGNYYINAEVRVNNGGTQDDDPILATTTFNFVVSSIKTTTTSTIPPVTTTIPGQVTTTTTSPSVTTTVPGQIITTTTTLSPPPSITTTTLPSTPTTSPSQTTTTTSPPPCIGEECNNGPLFLMLFIFTGGIIYYLIIK